MQIGRSKGKDPELEHEELGWEWEVVERDES